MDAEAWKQAPEIALISHTPHACPIRYCLKLFRSDSPVFCCRSPRRRSDAHSRASKGASRRNTGSILTVVRPTHTHTHTLVALWSLKSFNHKDTCFYSLKNNSIKVRNSKKLLVNWKVFISAVFWAQIFIWLIILKSAVDIFGPQLLQSGVTGVLQGLIKPIRCVFLYCFFS